MFRRARDSRYLPAIAAFAAASLLACETAGAQKIVPLPIYPIPMPVYPVPPAEHYGAIAYHRASGSHGYSYDFATEREASIAALNGCGHPECIVMVHFKSACGVLVNGPRGPFAATGATAAEAETRARAQCADPACEVVAWSCTR